MGFAFNSNIHKCKLCIGETSFVSNWRQFHNWDARQSKVYCGKLRIRTVGLRG